MTQRPKRLIDLLCIEPSSRRWLLFVLCTISIPVTSLSQDSIKTLSPDAFLDIVRKFHPVAKQADLLMDRANANLLSSRGAFDPAVYHTNDQKTFDGKNYFNYSNTELKIPTWFGIEVKAGLENNSGDRIDQELTQDRSSYAGISVPLAKNLLMDKRRAALQQAKAFLLQSRQDRLLQINDLLFDAIGSYWNWVKEYQVYRILSDAVKVNEDRYKLIRVTVEQGDRPAIDTTEALAQLINFRYLQNDAWLNFQNAGFELSNYLWQENEQPYLLPASVIPDKVLDTLNPFSIAYRPLEELIQTATTTHPKLLSYRYKMDALEIERKLKFQSLLPQLDVKYNILSKGYQFGNNWNLAAMQNNYKFGLQVGMPLFLRQGRGEYRSAKIKIRSTDLERNETRLSIENKVRFYHTTLVNQLQQIRLNMDAVSAFQKLFKAEEMRFNIGESTLFLLNSRENKVLESAQKLAEIKAKFFKSYYAVQWATGTLR